MIKAMVGHQLCKRFVIKIVIDSNTIDRYGNIIRIGFTFNIRTKICKVVCSNKRDEKKKKITDSHV